MKEPKSEADKMMEEIEDNIVEFENIKMKELIQLRKQYDDLRKIYDKLPKNQSTTKPETDIDRIVVL